jgi:hypothetical protein
MNSMLKRVGRIFLLGCAGVWLGICPAQAGYNGFVLSRGGEGNSHGSHMILWHQNLGVTHWNPDSDTQVAVTAGLLAYWQFDEAAGQTLTDSSPAHNHAFLGNAEAMDPADPEREESTVPVSFGDGLAIGYAEVAALAPLSSAQMEKLMQVSWYFAHASVGGNIVDGLYDLNAMSSSPFPLARIPRRRRPSLGLFMNTPAAIPAGKARWMIS